MRVRVCVSCLSASIGCIPESARGVTGGIIVVCVREGVCVYECVRVCMYVGVYVCVGRGRGCRCVCRYGCGFGSVQVHTHYLHAPKPPTQKHKHTPAHATVYTTSTASTRPYCLFLRSPSQAPYGAHRRAPKGGQRATANYQRITASATWPIHVSTPSAVTRVNALC
jgi:hypothetical protein